MLTSRFYQTGLVPGTLTKSPSTSVEVLSELAQDSELNVRIAVAWNEGAPEEVLALLKDEPYFYQVLEFKKEQGIVFSEKFLRELATSNQALVKRIVAYAPNCPTDLLVILADDESSHVRIAVAANPQTPANKLAKLSTDKEEIVRRKVARNPNTEKEVLVALAKDGRYTTRRAVAGNPNLPIETLRELAEDDEGHVRYWVASNECLPMDCLEVLAEDKFYEVRINVCQHPGCTDEILEKLMCDEIDIVCNRAKEAMKRRKENK